MAAEILGLTGYSIVPALLPQFIAAWSLSNTQAGWLAGIVSAGYMLAVIPLVSVTDRQPARRILSYIEHAQRCPVSASPCATVCFRRSHTASGLLLVFHANEASFQTGWFIESLATQVLVIFVLRTRRNPLRSHPHPLLATTSLAIVIIAVLLPFTPLGAWFGFVTPPAALLLAIAGLTASYLLLAESAKQAFFRLRPTGGIAPPVHPRLHLPLIGRS
jgi:magnesium-transporting ATPase (P-type)